jgi:membrane protein
MLLWVIGSYLLRWVLSTTAGRSTSIYGPLAAPIAVLLWLYLVSIAVLIGAAVNAAFDRVWPESETARARMEVVRRLRLDAILPRLRRDEEERARYPDEASETMELAVYDEPDSSAQEADTDRSDNGRSRNRQRRRARHRIDQPRP